MKTIILKYVSRTIGITLLLFGTLLIGVGIVILLIKILSYFMIKTEVLLCVVAVSQFLCVILHRK